MSQPTAAPPPYKRTYFTKPITMEEETTTPPVAHYTPNYSSIEKKVRAAFISENESREGWLGGLASKEGDLAGKDYRVCGKFL